MPGQLSWQTYGSYWQALGSGRMKYRAMKLAVEGVVTMDCTVWRSAGVQYWVSDHADSWWLIQRQLVSRAHLSERHWGCDSYVLCHVPGCVLL
jgi:hypothetical protein